MENFFKIYLLLSFNGKIEVYAGNGIEKGEGYPINVQGKLLKTLMWIG